MTVVTRFAPSPTGYLHVGGARTALFCYLFAKHSDGKFLLRIEDTDLERSTPESVQAIMDGMSWLGLASDDEVEYQTQHFDRYKAVTQDFLDKGLAYRCYCSKERLDALREKQKVEKQKPRYDGCCRELKEPSDAPYVIRFKNPIDGAVAFDDAVHGVITVSNQELDDVIIARTDGTPTYNFTVVVDDSDTGITHVIRGDDHINNTPRQINMLEALGATIPVYAHVPMILGDDGKRLSKRHGAVSVVQYRDEGYLPEALLNYLVRLGWSHGDQEIFSMKEMIELFDLNHISKSAAAFNTEKLQWLNQHYMKELDPEYVAKALAGQYQLLDIDVSDGPALTEVVIALRERVKTLKEMAEQSLYCYQPVGEYNEKAAKKFLTDEAKPVLTMALEQFTALSDWNQEDIHHSVKSMVEQLELKFMKVAQPLRIALTGNTVSPSIDVTAKLLGREKTLERIKAAVEFIS
jgi:glutamyl-tRNA synthetase